MPEDNAELFVTAFRGYDKAQVEDVVTALKAELDRRAVELDRQAAVEANLTEELRQKSIEVDAASARAEEAEQRLDRLAAEIQEIPLAESTDGESKAAPRIEFEEILRVAEEQANSVISNAVEQGEKFVAEARVEVKKLKEDTAAEAEAIRQRAEHELAQAQIRIETERTANQARIEQQLAEAADQVAQAEREAAAIRSEAERDAGNIRQIAETEAAEVRADAERVITEARAKQLEYETGLTRREDQAQQEFLALHNEAVAHSERIVKDANEKVQRALDHARRIEDNAKAFEESARAQAASAIASAEARSVQIIEGARDRAQVIVDAVISHTKEVSRDAEDRARNLRVQQQALSSFLNEVGTLVTGLENYQRGAVSAADEFLASSPELTELAEVETDEEATATKQITTNASSSES